MFKRFRFLNLIFFFFPLLLESAEEKATPTVCLNMIVKNEKDVITRCLESVLPMIDYWVIVDTGSSDGTQQIIKDYMASKSIPGELHERPWKNFGHNRNEALQLAKGKADYLFFIDADEYLQFDADFQMPRFDKDYYHLFFSHSGSRYSRIQLIRGALDWKWEGVLHEVLSPPPYSSCADLNKVVIVYTTEGARSKDPQKYLKDAQILEAALKEEPNNTRYLFYLAQSYRDAGQHAEALKYYEKSAEIEPWDQAKFWALFQVASLQETLGVPEAEVLVSYNKAYQYRRSRIEPVYHMAHLLRQKGDYHSAYLAAKIATAVPQSGDALFVQQWMHDYGALLELSIDAYWIGKYEECQQVSLELLKKPNLPPEVRSCIEANLGFANAKLLDTVLQSTGT